MEELLFGTIRMHIPDAQFCVSTDSMALADFCRLPSRARVLDLGCGCGTLGLLLLGAAPELLVDGIEIQPDAARQAAQNAEANSLADRFRVFCGDLRQMPPELAPGSYDCVVSNPPYYPPGSGYLRHADSLSIARSELTCPLDALCARRGWSRSASASSGTGPRARSVSFCWKPVSAAGRGCNMSRIWFFTNRTAARLPTADASTTDRSECTWLVCYISCRRPSAI